MYLLDANVIIANFRKNETRHINAKKFIAKLSGFVVTDYILAEVATVLQVREGKVKAIKAIDFLTSTASILHTRLTQEELEMTLDLFLKQEEGLSFVDASLLILGKERGYTIVTLDQGLTKAAHKRF